MGRCFPVAGLVVGKRQQILIVINIPPWRQHKKFLLVTFEILQRSLKHLTGPPGNRIKDDRQKMLARETD